MMARLVTVGLSCALTLTAGCSSPVIKTTPATILELNTWSWHTADDYAVANGLVTNVSDQRLERVYAVVAWYTSTDQYITSSQAIIEYDPIMPGQSSQFKVTCKANPLMDTASVSFATRRGDTIQQIPSADSLTLTPTIITDWSGSGNTVTKPFTINSFPWKVSWEAGEGDFTFAVMDHNGRQIAGSYNAGADKHTITILDKGDFSLVIESKTTWYVKVVAVDVP